MNKIVIVVGGESITVETDGISIKIGEETFHAEGTAVRIYQKANFPDPIGLIKAIRAASGVGLRDAKELMESIRGVRFWHYETNDYVFTAPTVDFTDIQCKNQTAVHELRNAVIALGLTCDIV
jgi:hypothetical protein